MSSSIRLLSGLKQMRQNMRHVRLYSSFRSFSIRLAVSLFKSLLASITQSHVKFSSLYWCEVRDCKQPRNTPPYIPYPMVIAKKWTSDSSCDISSHLLASPCNREMTFGAWRCCLESDLLPKYLGPLKELSVVLVSLPLLIHALQPSPRWQRATLKSNRRWHSERRKRERLQRCKRNSCKIFRYCRGIVHELRRGEMLDPGTSPKGEEIHPPLLPPLIAIPGDEGGQKGEGRGR